MRTTLVIAILLLLCGVGLCVESQQPTPRTLQANTQQIKDSNHPQQTATSLPHSTPETRSTTSVLTKPEPKMTKNDKTDQSLSDWCLVLLTGVLAYVTYRLVVQTRRLVDETSHASKRQAAETQDALQLSQRAAAAAEKAVELTQQSFLASHRPRIILRDAYCSSVKIGEFIEVHYVLANSGETPGTIVGAAFSLKNLRDYSNTFGAHVLPDAGIGINQLGEFTLQPGEQRAFTFTSNQLRWTVNDGTRHDSPEQHIGVFFSGHLVYEDDRGIRRNMAFHRRHKIGPERFFKSEDKYISALEYE